MTQTEREILIKWLEGPFHKACNEDVMRLRESLWMLKVGHVKGERDELSMSIAIASFVKGLILGEVPITVPKDPN